MVNTQSELMTRAQTLMKQKDDIEADIKKAQDELQSQKVGMTERLIDNNGFPRSDIDLVVVTTARSNIIRLKNDHKEIMLQIEEALHAVHAEAITEREAREAERKAHGQESSGASAAGSSSAAQEADKDLSPFARVNGVAPDSPAKEAGLLQGDMIVAFGSVNAKTPNVLPSLSEHVQSRENKPILVKILRGESADLHSLILVPKQGWGGRGLLGCHIVPV